MRRVGWLLAVVAIIAAPMTLGARQATAFPGAEGRIVYVDDTLDEWPVIASMAANGTDPLQLTQSSQSEFGDYEPRWSPGGTMIVFTRTTDVSEDVWRMNANGTGQKKLSAGFTPSWSADGSKIVFASDRTGDIEIYSMDLNGGAVKRLTFSPGDDITPAWSPLNDRIAFSSLRNDLHEIFTMKPDGSNVLRQTIAPEDTFHFAPNWSPNGDRITFTSYLFTETDATATIKLLNPANGNVTTIVTPGPYDENPAYSPRSTSRRIVFNTDSLGELEVAVVPEAGGATDVLTDTHDGSQSVPDWQPIPTFPLVDAQFSTFKNDIEWVYAEGITVGCSAERYCPDEAVTRGQMATFLVRALNLPPTATDYFTDDNGTTHEQNINRVRAANITSGCTATTYCPNAVVTREQMATFLTKGFALPSTTTDYFTDDETSSHEVSINRVRAAGITTGCTPTTYCPLADVTRGQMAAFLRRALE